MAKDLATLIQEDRKILDLTPQVAVALKKYFEYIAEGLEDDPQARKLKDFISAAIDALTAVVQDDLKFFTQSTGHLPVAVKEDLERLVQLAKQDFDDTRKLRQILSMIQLGRNTKEQIQVFLKHLSILRGHIQDETQVLEQGLQEQAA